MRSAITGLIIRLVVLGLIGALFFGISKIDFDDSPKHFRVSKAAVDVEVQPDGSLRVRERLTYEFTGPFSGAYRDIPLAAGASAREIEVAEDGKQYDPGGATAVPSYDRPGTFGAVGLRFDDGTGTPNRGFRVVWHYSALDETRVFDVEYTVDGVATAYEDVVDVEWIVWGDQWQFWLDELDASISLADTDADSPSPLAAWVGPGKLDATPDLELGAARLSLERAPEGERVRLRATFPRSALPLAGTGNEKRRAGFSEIRAEEIVEATETSSLDKLAARIARNIVAVCLGWTLLLLAIAAALYLAARERSDPVPGYLSEPPEDIPPALAYAIVNEGGFDDRLVVATLLDLVDRGFYDAKPDSGEDLDLEVSIAEDRPDEELGGYELIALDFFDRLLREGPSPLGKLKDRIPEHSESWRNRWTNLTAELDRAEEGELLWDRDLTPQRALLATVGMIGYLTIIALYYDRTHLLLLPLFAMIAGLTLIYALPATALRRLDQDSRKRNAEWKAFARWTHDFPRLEDDPPSSLKLWRRVLVYAVAFGTAERVIGSGRIPAPVLAEAAQTSLWVGPHLAGSGSGITPSFNGFASSFSSHVAPESSSDGGGFSGGGGGSSGGGGGGAW